MRDTHFIGRVKRLPNGELLVDTDSLRRPHFDGDYVDDLGDDDDYDDDDFGYDDDDDDDDFGADYVDDLGDDYVDDIGARGSRRRRRLRRRAGRKSRKASKLRRKAGGGRRGRKADTAWAKTVLSGNVTLGAAGAGTITIRPQHQFKAEDITFQGSLAASSIDAIFFGDQLVWSTPSGVDVSVFAVTGFMRELLRGQQLRAGLDITINCTLPGAGTVAATLTGYKPATAQNCG